MTIDLSGAAQCGAPVHVWAPSGQPPVNRICFRDVSHDGPHLSEPDFDGDH
jgi:hypothetical protein